MSVTFSPPTPFIGARRPRHSARGGSGMGQPSVHHHPPHPCPRIPVAGNYLAFLNHRVPLPPSPQPSTADDHSPVLPSPDSTYQPSTPSTNSSLPSSLADQRSSPQSVKYPSSTSTDRTWRTPTASTTAKSTPALVCMAFAHGRRHATSRPYVSAHVLGAPSRWKGYARSRTELRPQHDSASCTLRIAPPSSSRYRAPHSPSRTHNSAAEGTVPSISSVARMDVMRAWRVCRTKGASWRRRGLRELGLWWQV